MRTIVVNNSSDVIANIKGIRQQDNGEPTTFYVMPRAKATLTASAFFDLNRLPQGVHIVDDSNWKKTEVKPPVPKVKEPVAAPAAEPVEATDRAPVDKGAKNWRK